LEMCIGELKSFHSLLKWEQKARVSASTFGYIEMSTKSVGHVNLSGVYDM
jgi:hypothetical protein